MKKYWSPASGDPFEEIIGKLSELSAAESEMRDFSRTLVIVPGRLWLRNLKEALIRKFPDGLFPPRILTPGGVLRYGAENLHRVSPGEECAVWEKVVKMRQTSSEFTILRPGGGILSEKDCRTQAELFSELHQEVARNGMTFAEAAERLSDDPRWQALAALEVYFKRELALLSLPDPVETDRACAKMTQKLAEDFDRVFLAFLPDLPPLLKEKLTPLESRLICLIQGDETDAAAFNKWGEPTGIWSERMLPFGEKNLHPVMDVESAALLTLHLATKEGREPFDPQKSAIALGRSSFFYTLERCFGKLHYENEAKHIVLFSPEGVSGHVLRIGQFMEKLYLALSDPEDFSSLAAWVKDSAFLGFLRQGTGLGENAFLSLLDAFITHVLPDRTAPALCFLKETESQLETIFRSAAQWLKKLSSSADFLPELRKLLKQVFSRPSYVPFRAIAFDDEVCFWQKALENLDSSPVKPLLDTPRKMLRYLLDECEAGRFYPGRDDDAILIYNFLELPALRQKELFLIGLNWGIVPAVPGVTPYLTDRIRQRLGLASSVSLRALESYKLISLLRSSHEVHLIVPKRDETNSPLRPCGLLFQGCTPERLMARAERCRDPELLELSLPAAEAESAFRINLTGIREAPFLRKTPLEFSVTDFKNYLASPRAFLLQKVCGIECRDYENRELDAADFGSACHKGFEDLLDRECRSEEEYFSVLQKGVDRYLREKCGNPLPLLVELQRRQISARLQAAARCFAASHGSYRLLKTEYALHEGKGILFGGALIKGKIDRIELLNDQHTLRLIDIKTYYTARSPEKDHLAGRAPNQRLVNLQLPLYERLLRLDTGFWEETGLDPETTVIQTGYFLLTADSDTAELMLWENDFDHWCNEAQLAVQGIVSALERFRDGGEPDPEPANPEYNQLASLFLPNGQEAVVTGGAQ